MADSSTPALLPCGLINAANRYLSAEPFRFQVVATGLVLRPRQVWVLRFVSPQGAGAAGHDEERGQRLHLLSSLKRFLAADPNGKVTCDQESPGPGALFLLRQYPDGKVSLQCELTQRYLGGAEDNVTCFAQTVSEGEKWSLQLAQHPNVHLLNPGKQRYLRCDQQTGHLRCDRDLPWGPEAVLTLHFDLKVKRYGLQTGAGTLLATDGSLQAEQSPQTLYCLELRGGLLALRDADGRYVTGREGIVKTFKTDKPGRDELFALEPSVAQVSLRTFAGGRYVSCRAGSDVYANASAVGNTEIFQLLLNDVTKQACFRSSSGTYLAVGPKDAVVSTSALDKGVWFSLQYQAQKVMLRTADGRYMATRPNGQLLVVPEVAGKEEFLLLLVNRPLLILQSEAGFVGLFPGTRRLDGNRPTYDASTLMFSETGLCHFRVANKYWSLDKDGLIMADGDHPSDFILQFVSSSCLVLKAPNNKYLVAEAGGRLWAGASDAASATLFHY